RRLVGEAGCTAANAVFFNGATVATCGSPYLSGNPALATITQISGTESTGKQRYDGLQASLTKRYSQGFQLQLSYTWSKTMTNSIGYYGDSGQSASNSAYWPNLDKSGTTSRGARANCIGPSGGNHAVGLGAFWFNTSVFSQPTSGFGSCGNNIVVGPGLREFDLGVQKQLPVTESKRFEFRAEFIN